MSIIERAQAPTPKFFKVLRNIGLVLASVGGLLLTAPVALPAAVVTLGGYLVLGGGVLSAASQVTVDEKAAKASETTDSSEDAE